jgi:LmbE family N-acetylglucosaminyl deacetylase
MTPDAILHVAPHPDDELLGAGLTLLELRRAGFRIVDAIVSLGRASDAGTRRREAQDVADRVGFDLVLPTPRIALSSRDATRASAGDVAEFVASLIDEYQPTVVVTPSPHDGHPAHELVGRAVRDAMEGRGGGCPWWMWGLWSELPIPTLFSPVAATTLAEVAAALGLYRSQLARNDYGHLLEARAAASAVLGVERVFGFGACPSVFGGHAELFCEAIWSAGRWWLGRPRVLEPAAPVASVAPVDADIGAWLHQASARQLLRDGDC